MINIIKFIFFSLILMTFIECKTSISDISSYTSGNPKDRHDYLLVFRGSDKNGSLNSDFTRYYIKTFFSTPSWPFFMNYNIIPSRDDDPNQGYEEIVGEIQKISAKLDYDSTFIFFISAHGGEDGICYTGQKVVKAEDVIRALKEGLDKNPKTKTFQRFIIINNSCHSGKFIGDFQENKSTRDGSLFKEGIYIYSTDASQVAYGMHTSEIFIPMFTFLRELQVRRCRDNTTNYQELYKSVLDDIINIRIKGIHVVERYYGNIIIDQIKKLFGEDNRIGFYQPPRFYDLLKIIERINSQKTNKGNPSMNIQFNDEYQTSQQGLIRSKTIFPDLENCK